MIYVFHSASHVTYLAANEDVSPLSLLWRAAVGEMCFQVDAKHGE